MYFKQYFPTVRKIKFFNHSTTDIIIIIIQTDSLIWPGSDNYITCDKNTMKTTTKIFHRRVKEKREIILHNVWPECYRSIDDMSHHQHVFILRKEYPVIIELLLREAI